VECCKARKITENSGALQIKKNYQKQWSAASQEKLLKTVERCKPRKITENSGALQTKKNYQENGGALQTKKNY
jgi:hypothetical protein